MLGSRSMHAFVVTTAAALVCAGLCTGCRPGAATATTAAADAKTQAEASAELNGATTTASGQRPKLLPGAKTKVLAAAGDKPYDKTFDDIRFEMKLDEPFRREMLTDSIESMFGERIRIRGYILPTAQKSGVREFVLVRDNQECCFGPGAALYDCIFVQMQPGKTTEYSTYPVAVEGTFGFKEIVGPDGRHLAIYHLEGETAR
jgi:hypothetical protein